MSLVEFSYQNDNFLYVRCMGVYFRKVPKQNVNILWESGIKKKQTYWRLLLKFSHHDVRQYFEYTEYGVYDDTKCQVLVSLCKKRVID